MGNKGFIPKNLSTKISQSSKTLNHQSVKNISRLNLVFKLIMSPLGAKNITEPLTAAKHQMQ